MMYTQDFASWSTMGKNFFEPIFDLQKITMPFAEKFTQETISLISDNTAATVKYMQTMNKTSKLDDLLKAQLICLTEQGERNLQHGQRFLKIVEEGLKEYRHIASDKMDQIFSAAEEPISRGKKSNIQ